MSEERRAVLEELDAEIQREQESLYWMWLYGDLDTATFEEEFDERYFEREEIKRELTA